MEDLLQVTLQTVVTLDDSFSEETRTRAAKLKIAIDRMKHEPITDESLMSDILEAMELIVSVYRRAKAIGNV